VKEFTEKLVINLKLEVKPYNFYACCTNYEAVRELVMRHIMNSYIYINIMNFESFDDLSIKITFDLQQ